MFHRLFVLLCAGALCLGLATPRAEAASFTFTKIAGTDTAIPGSFGNFQFFGIPVLDGSFVVLNGNGTCCPIQTGVYAGTGGPLQTLADFLTPIPGGSGNFSFLGDAAASGGIVAFEGAGGTSSGVYTGTAGSLTSTADTNTPIPGGVGNFQSFGAPMTVDNGRVVFVGTGSSLQRGVYSFAAGSGGRSRYQHGHSGRHRQLRRLRLAVGSRRQPRVQRLRSRLRRGPLHDHRRPSREGRGHEHSHTRR